MRQKFTAKAYVGTIIGAGIIFFLAMTGVGLLKNYIPYGEQLILGLPFIFLAAVLIAMFAFITSPEFGSE